MEVCSAKTLVSIAQWNFSNPTPLYFDKIWGVDICNHIQRNLSNSTTSQSNIILIPHRVSDWRGSTVVPPNPTLFGMQCKCNETKGEHMRIRSETPVIRHYPENMYSQGISECRWCTCKLLTVLCHSEVC